MLPLYEISVIPAFRSAYFACGVGAGLVSVVLAPVSVSVQELFYGHISTPVVALEAGKAVVRVVVGSSLGSSHDMFDSWL